MNLKHKEWLKAGNLIEELRGLFEELPDQELAYLKKLVVEEGRRYLEEKKSCSDRSVSEGTQPTHTNVRG